MKKANQLSMFFAVAVVLSSFVACSSNDPGGPGPVPTDNREHSTTGTSWTFLVYMVADNNLEPAGVSDLQEMLQVGSNDTLNIIVQADRAAEYSTDPVANLPDWQSTKRLKIDAGSVVELEDLGELNMGDPSVLSNFIDWGVKTYPADRVALIFWDHGGAWPGFGGDESTADHDVLSLAELRQGLTDGMNRSGLKQFALLGFDACLMATFETAVALKDYSEYLLASEELEPGHGWDYNSLKILRDTPGTSPLDLSKEIIKGFKTQAQQSQTDENITLSVMDLYKVSQLENAVATFADTVKANINSLSVSVGRQRQAVLAYGKNPNPAADPQMIDLGHFAQLLAQEKAEVAAAKDQLTAAIQGVVASKDAGPQAASSTGISIYFPATASLYNLAYDQLAGVDKWRDMLKSFQGAGATIQTGEKPQFTNANHVGEVQSSGNDVIISGSLAEGTSANVVKLQLFYGVVDGDFLYALGDRPGALNGSQALGSWGANALVISQGSSSSYAYLGEAVSGTNIQAGIPFSYVETGSQAGLPVLLSMTIDSSTGSILQYTFYLVTEGGVGQLYPQPGSAIYPILMQIDQSGQSQWVPTEVAFDPTIPLSFNMQTIEAGTNVYLELDAYDYGGNADYVYWQGALN